MVLSILGILGIMLLVVAIGAYAYFPNVERKLLYGALPRMRRTPSKFNVPYREVAIQSSDDITLTSWLLLPEGEDYTSRPWVIYFHGNASNISYKLDYPCKLYKLGYNVMMVEYRGFMGNPGEPSEKGLYADAQAHYEYLRSLGVEPKYITLHGFSMGTGVAVELASRVEIARLILEAPYTSIPEIARHLYGRLLVNFLFRTHFRSIDKIKTITVPLMVLHSQDDPVVPFYMGERLYNLSPGHKEFIEMEGGHSVLSGRRPPQALVVKIDQFIQTHPYTVSLS